MPSICIPPWAGGVTPPSAVHAHEENVPRNAADAKAKCAFSQRCRTRAIPPTVLPSAAPGGALWSSVQNDLGHFDDLLDVRQLVVEDLQHFHHGVHQLRLKSVEKRDDGCRVDDLLHDAPRDSLRRQPVRPRAPELQHAIVVEEEVLRAGLLGGGCLRNSTVYFFSNPPRPLPSSGAVRCGAGTRQGPLRRSGVHT